MVSIVVVGAGVIGLSAATHLLERFQRAVTVTIIADKFTPNTTASDKSGGIIVLPQIGESDKACGWAEDTLKRLETLYDPEKSSVNGITFFEGCTEMYKSSSLKGDLWRKIYKDYRIIDMESEWNEFRIPPLNEGHCFASFSTYTVNCSLYLPWLLKRFKGLGGTTEERKITNLSELAESYDIVINCTGLGARELANDEQVYPVRGHMVSISAPWIKQYLLLGQLKSSQNERVYMIPQYGRVLIGGTYCRTEDDVGEEDSVIFEKIIKRCKEVIPSISDASIIEKWVGIRPLRKGGTRLEKEELPHGSGLLVHCYGHGHFGVSLSWGCAEEIGNIVEASIKLKN
ncbi:PREDICTED: D-aspartate oxidase-like [Amphimedon queenslandica]|uniref:FAD dependent oxidoreductase domain-containing protein n=1 Tax=Amphimedon queenslandica TaxID=400682 RepID=A0A1X7TJ52_AMPQE|nr:PREDICTED: D-aspartate oxidase-like [Amphimedon queenslandica]|eukprot:XP_011407418.1 PREDICTED: D-aspartate oxidase-like [Amphimedon queenslandica]